MRPHLKLFAIVAFVYVAGMTAAAVNAAQAGPGDTATEVQPAPASGDAGAATTPAVTAPDDAKAVPAAPAVPVAEAPGTPDDPKGWSSSMLAKLRSTEWLPAFGFGLMLTSWAIRSGLYKGLGWEWAGKPWGGRAIAFTGAALMVFGPAFAEGKPPSVGLLSTAFAAGWAASGMWEDSKDLGRKAHGTA